MKKAPSSEKKNNRLLKREKSLAGEKGMLALGSGIEQRQGFFSSGVVGSGGRFKKLFLLLRKRVYRKWALS